MIKIGVFKESQPERRVALMPEEVSTLVKLKAEVWIEEGAGQSAMVSDEDYLKAGGKVGNMKDILDCQVLLGIQAPTQKILSSLNGNHVLFAMLNPMFEKQTVNTLVEKHVTSFSLELVPRTTRAQSMDVLSSMATVAGYKAVLDAASRLPKFFPMFMTAAGTIKPARLLILGAGVAGLQAIATARKLGAVVEVFDVRRAVKEEVMSLGGKFIEVEGAIDDVAAGGYAVEQSEEFKKRQAQKIHDHAVKCDVVICTAQIPGKKAPVLLKKETVDAMTPGSVIIDLAASTGGNCELTSHNEIKDYKGIAIVGNSSFPSEMPADASRMFGKNLVNLLKLFIDKEGNLTLNFEDDIVLGTCLTRNGEVLNERVKSALV